MKRIQQRAYHRVIPAIILVGLFACFVFSVNSTTALAAPAPQQQIPSDLKLMIDQKNKEMQEIGNQIKTVQDQLETTGNQKQTLQSELNRINGSVRQLNLGIQRSSVAVEKLGYEMQDTQYSIDASQQKINEKKQTIAEMIRQMQQTEQVNSPVSIILQGKSLADSLFEVQGLMEFQTQFSNDISDLQTFKQQLDQHLHVAADQKHQKEVEAQNLKNQKIIVEETKKYQQDLLRQTKNKEKLYQESLADLKKRQDQIDLEIAKLEEAARKQINVSELPKANAQLLIMPTQGKLTQGYGATAFARTHYASHWHNGIDIGAPIGTPIIAAADGRVVGVGNQDLYCYRGAYGKFVAITHENGLSTLYAHMSLQVASEGQYVHQGDVIGYIGNTGMSFGSHLHFTVYASNTFKIAPALKTCGPKMPFGGDLNPFDYLAK